MNISINLPVCVEDEIFIINKETNSIMSCAVKSIFSTDETGVEWEFTIEFNCEDCDRFCTCDCCAEKCIWGDCQIYLPHGDEEDIIGYTSVKLSDYNKTWFTERDKAVEFLRGEKWILR